jgi:hypothetical protein
MGHITTHTHERPPSHIHSLHQCEDKCTETPFFDRATLERALTALSQALQPSASTTSASTSTSTSTSIQPSAYLGSDEDLHKVCPVVIASGVRIVGRAVSPTTGAAVTIDRKVCHLLRHSDHIRWQMS